MEVQIGNGAIKIRGDKSWFENVLIAGLSDYYCRSLHIEGVHHSILGQSDEVCLNMFNLSVVVDLTHGF